MKMTLSESKALAHFDPTLPLDLACDASPYGVDTVMSHIIPSGEERLIAFALKRDDTKLEALPGETK